MFLPLPRWLILYGPGPDLFVTSIVILVTLVAQGLRLPLLIDGLKVRQAIRLQLKPIDVERTMLNGHRASTPLNGETLRKIEQELDLEAARLSSLQPADENLFSD